MSDTTEDQQPTEHLNKVELAVKTARELLAQNGYPDDLRTAIVIASIDQMIEHHTALLLLIRSSLVGSGFALLRPIVEGMYRAMWINCCATNEAVKTVDRDDKNPLTVAQMAHELDDEGGTGGFFCDLKDRAWHSLNSYPAYWDAAVRPTIYGARFRAGLQRRRDLRSNDYCYHMHTAICKQIPCRPELRARIYGCPAITRNVRSRLRR